jgi:hypothetical protein
MVVMQTGANIEEAHMRLVLLGIDPDTDGGHCPAVFTDEETGDLLFQGSVVSDPGVLADVARHSPIGDGESVVRLPARMKQVILEAADGSHGSAVQ